MNAIAIFEKVTFEQFYKDFIKAFKLGPTLSSEREKQVRKIYDEIKLPKRATEGSAGYDFFIPESFIFYKDCPKTIPTGIRCKMSNGWVLNIYPRSGLGFKTGIHLANTVGIIDADYYFADNEGHIMVKVVPDSVLTPAAYKIEKGEAFCQGVFLPFGITTDDDVTDKRRGGFGSTTKKTSLDTGCRDVSGRRIYVGDTVVEGCNGLTGKVVWDDEFCTYKLEGLGDYFIKDSEVEWRVVKSDFND